MNDEGGFPPRKKQSSQLRRFRDQLLVLWNLSETEIPPRPDDPDKFPETDERHWYDLEHAGWHVVKQNIPQSPGGGPVGKRVFCLLPATNMYQRCYHAGAREAAQAAGVDLTTRFAGENGESQEEQLRWALAARPDLIILNPENAQQSVSWFRSINETGIPVIATNFRPLPASFAYIVAWTGPDDWGQARMLARSFADLLGCAGGYSIFRHVRGSSCWYARTYGVLTELRKAAPAMTCLSFEESNLDEEVSYQAARRLLLKQGRRLRGIVSSDDNETLKGINRAVSELGREDIIRVAFGTTSVGLAFLQEGKAHALAWQSPAVDGALAMRVAVDWFSGLQVQPLRYLPKHIVTARDVSDFVEPHFSIASVDIDRLYRAIENCQESTVYRFFDDIYVTFVNAHIIKEEEFRGFSIELLSSLLSIIRANGLCEQDIIGSYEDLYKKLFMQRSLEKTLEWMCDLSLSIIGRIAANRRKQTLIQRVIESIEGDQMKAVSLKVLAGRFDISRIYLGQLFRKETGKSFTNYINERRVESAKKLLRSTSLKASEIAALVGYSSANYFYRVFKKYAGVYPSEYIEPFRRNAVT
ncbi:MAG TPA: substrate-binding domain-containing protein [Spirochaetia bacterium]|nr:substrate-binding domain-containing protein [Spirochaetia bacterium]